MALDPLKRSRQRQGPSLAFHTIGVQGYFGSVQPPPPPPLSEILGSAPAGAHLDGHQHGGLKPAETSVTEF